MCRARYRRGLGVEAVAQSPPTRARAVGHLRATSAPPGLVSQRPPGREIGV